MKRASRNTKLYVGGFALFSVLIVTLVVFFAGDDLALFKDKSQFFVSLHDASGLQAGAPVKMGGVTVGNVDAIAIDSRQGVVQVVATIIVYAPHDRFVRRDSVVQMKTQGVLGDKYLTITAGSQGEAKIATGNFLRAEEETDFSNAIKKSTEILDSAASAATDLKGFTNGLPEGDSIQQIVSDMQASSRALRSILSELASDKSSLKMITNPKTAAKVDQILANLYQSSTHFESVANKIDSGQGTLGALVNDPSLYDDMRLLLGRANRSKLARFVIDQAINSDANPTKSRKKAEAQD